MADYELQADLALAKWLAEEEITRQENVVLARNYYAGEHDTKLTERQKEFLYFQRKGQERFAVNYCAVIVNAVCERLLVKGFGGKNEDLSAWAWGVWQDNRMDAKQLDVHRGAIRDGEYFVFVDWDDIEARPVLLPHPRYTDPIADGTGFGCKAFYPNDDVNQPMEKASKRWTEEYLDARGRTKRQRRMNVYYPNRVEKWVLDTGNESGWAPLETEGEQWPVPWVGVRGEPLGIPIVHFYNPMRRSELWDAIPPQDLINKTALDIIATADAAGFPIRFVTFDPTTDGLPPEDDGSNYIKLFPGAWVKVPADSQIQVLDPADIAKLLESLDSWIVKLAQITDTPISRFQLSRQIAAEGTLKQQEAPLLGKVRARQANLGNGWENCLYVARNLANVYGAGLDTEATLSTLWEPAETRDDKAFREALELEMRMGVPKEKLWEKLGYDQDEIAKMRAMVGEEMQQTANIGGALLEAFEGGGGVEPGGA